ncbi:MAG: helix-turn-helix transcriptional regulator [Candidatus Gastranaerophilales bacterium]|nr:helix-turn-helix transcriptional regulator [Candidatus Gastranaerophilales bacterium]
MENIGLRIKNIRKLLNKSQEELASEVSLTKQAISNIETAKSAPGINLLSKLLLDYNVNLNYIIGGMGDIFITKDKTYESLRASLIKEVELFLDNRGIN